MPSHEGKKHGRTLSLLLVCGTSGECLIGVVTTYKRWRGEIPVKYLAVLQQPQGANILHEINI